MIIMSIVAFVMTCPSVMVPINLPIPVWRPSVIVTPRVAVYPKIYTVWFSPNTTPASRICYGIGCVSLHFCGTEFSIFLG